MPLKVINSKPITFIEYWRQFIKYKSLIWIFANQEIKAQFAPTFFGLLWVVLRPLVILSIFTVLFSYLLKIQTSSPYYLFAFSGMIAWNFFSQIVGMASQVIVQRQDLIKRMYFPKIILPLSKTIVAGTEMLVSFVILLLLIIFSGKGISWHIIALPVFVLLNICVGLMLAIWMNVLNIRYRDLHQIVTPVISIGVWFTPVFFPVTIIPTQYQFLLYLNPMAGVIAGYRYALLGEQFPGGYYWVCFAVVLILLLFGVRYLIRVEEDIVDKI